MRFIKKDIECHLGTWGILFTQVLQKGNPSWVICTILMLIVLVGISRMTKIALFGYLICIIQKYHTEILQNCNEALYNVKQTLKRIQALL